MTLAVAAAMLAVNQVAVGAIGSPQVAENNSQAVILKTQQYEFGEVPTGVLTGSSISGRLNAADFAAAGFPLANLGLDGLSPAFGLDVILEQETLPEFVLVEVNTLDKGVGANAATIDSVRNGFGYDLARLFPMIRADSRPVTVVYSEVRSRRNSGFVSVPGEVPIVETLIAPGAEPSDVADVVAVEASIEALKDKGVRVVLVLLPTGEDETAAHLVGEAVSSRTQTPMLDLSGLPDDPGYFTDGVHLTPTAATAVATALGEYLAGAN